MQALLFGPYLTEPLERDEGAYAYIAQRLPAGELPYRDIYDHKPPAVYFIYALIFKLLGQSVLSIRTFTLFYSMLTTLSLFAVGYLMWGRMGGMLAALFYAFFSGGPYIQGTSANTETFMVLPMVLALLCFLRATRDGGRGTGANLFMAGVFSGLAVMIKQVAAANFLVLAGLAGLISLIPLFLGFTAFPLIFTLFFWFKGALPDMLNSVIFENLAYVGDKVWRWNFFMTAVGRDGLLLWGLSLLAILYIFLKDRKRENILLAVWGVFSVLAIIPGRSFYGHYFIQTIPGLALLSTYLIVRSLESKVNWKKAAAFLFTLFLLALPALKSRLDFNFLSPDEISLKKYAYFFDTNFVLMREIAAHIRSKTSPNDYIYVWGAEPEVYFYTQRRSASKYIYYYPLMYNTEKAYNIYLKVVDDVRQKRPRYIISLYDMAYFGTLYKHVQSNYRLASQIEKWRIWEIKK